MNYLMGLLVFFGTFSVWANNPTLDVPMRIDLGVERCEDRCRRTEYLGKNIIITITQIEDWPEKWVGSWKDTISYDGKTYKGSVDLYVEATPDGYVFRVTKEVDGSSHVDWIGNMGQLKINEVRAPRRKVGKKTHMPYIITSKKYNHD